MPYSPDSQAHTDFIAALAVYQSALSPSQLSGGFADGRPVPPVYDAGHDEISCYAYASWYSQLSDNRGGYVAGGHLPPIPPALA